MHIAIDARELAGQPTGAGRYLRGLLDVWAADPRARAHRWSLYSHQSIDTPLGAARLLPGSGGAWWEQRVLPAALRVDRPDVLFAPAYTAPIVTGVPRVVTVHDLSYFAHPKWFRFREGARRRRLTSLAARRARIVLTDSEFSRREILRHLRVSADRVRVIYPGVTPRPHGRGCRLPLVLFAGSIFNRRHLPDLIRGFARLARTRADLRLEIAGDDRTFPREDLAHLVASEGVRGAVTIRAYVDDTTLDELYGGARAFAFLSEYEGFGLTPLEALTAGVPPLVLDTPVAREICGGAAVYVDSIEPDAVAHALGRALFDEAERARVLQAAPAVLARYRWDAAAAATLEALEKAGS